MGGQTIEAVVFKTLGAAVRVIGAHMIARRIVMVAGGVAECVGNRFQVAEFGVSKAGSLAGTIGIAHQLAVGIVVQPFAFTQRIGNAVGQPLLVVMVTGGVAGGVGHTD